MSIVTDFRSFKDFRQKLETSDSDDKFLYYKENKTELTSKRIIVKAGPLTDDLMIDAAQLEKLFWVRNDRSNTLTCGKYPIKNKI